MAKKKGNRRVSKNSQGLAIACLIINIFIPGLGSLIGGKIKEGIWQLVLLLGSVFLAVLLFITIVGIPLGIILIIFGPLIAWIWGIVTGARLIQEAS